MSILSIPAGTRPSDILTPLARHYHEASRQVGTATRDVPWRELTATEQSAAFTNAAAILTAIRGVLAEEVEAEAKAAAERYARLRQALSTPVLPAPPKVIGLHDRGPLPPPAAEV